MSSSNARRSGRVRRTRNDQPVVTDPVQVVTVEDDSSCIDLTHEVDEDVVDLTAVNETPVVVLGPQPHRRAVKRRRHRLVLRDDESAVDSQSLPSSNQQILEPRSDDWELPDIPSIFDKSPPPSTSSITEPKEPKKRDSSPVKKISCPICLDDLKQFQEDKRHLVSTICGHLFCDSCLKESIRAQHCCPSCRKKLNMKQFHPIFL